MEKRLQESLQEEQLIRGFIFACTKETESECLNRHLFGTDRVYGPIVVRIRKGDLIFLNNVDTNRLYGVFKATSDGGFKIEPEAFGGRYPYQVKVRILGQTMKLDNADMILERLGVKRNTPLFGRKLLELLDLFIPQRTLLNDDDSIDSETLLLIMREKSKD